MPPSLATPAPACPPAVRARVFGLDVSSERPLGLLRGAPRAGARRPVRVSFHPRPCARSVRAQAICDRRGPGGEELLRILADDEGYEVRGSGHGSFALSVDGSELRCCTLGTPAGWERFLVGQVLPFAALLAGLEIFHAGAVDWCGAVAFLGASEAGKTSLALAMCDRGAGFLADDVLALEPWGERLLAHPGTPAAAVVHDRTGGRRESARDGEAHAPLPAGSEEPAIAPAPGTLAPPRPVPLGAGGEELVGMPGAPGPALLTAAFLLDRTADGPFTPRFSPLTDPRVLITSSFNLVLSTPSRLLRLLDVCALASRVRVERLEARSSLAPEEIAAAVIDRLGDAP